MEKKRFGLSEVEKQSRWSKSWHSIRTRYSLATAFFLVSALVVFYVGGRIVLVHLVRESEQQVKDIGLDISRVAYANADHVRKIAASAIVDFRDRTSFVDQHPEFPLVAEFGPDGSFDGGSLRNGAVVGFIAAADIAPYVDSLRRWTVATLKRGDGETTTTGIVRLSGVSYYVAMFAVNGRGVLVGIPFDSQSFSNQINENFSGVDIRITNRRTEVSAAVRPARGVRRSSEKSAFGIAPMFSEALNFYSGGFWELGSTPFEAVFALRDIEGNAVSIVTVSTPESFKNVTEAAIGRLVFFIAIGGIIFVMPIFWFQSRVLLNPLTRMTKRIAALGRHNADIDCPRLEWTGKDEFALLAVSVNRMLETISARSIEIANADRIHRALIDGLPDSLLVFDSRGRLVTVSKYAEGFSAFPGMLQGEPPSAAVYGEGPVRQFIETVSRVVEKGTPAKTRLSVMRPIGGSIDLPTRHFELRFAKLDERFALAVLRDITDLVNEHRLRIASEARAKDEEKRESLTLLAAGIAHDMNNVLSVILGAAESSDADPSGDSGPALQTIRSAVRRGSSMMAELRTFAGDNRVALLKVNPKLVLDDIRLLAERVVPLNVSVIIDEESGELPPIDADPNQFWKVLFNIAKNAGEAIGDRTGTVRLSVRPYRLTGEDVALFKSGHPLAPGNGVVFSVKDDGPGIDPSLLPRLFDPYVSSKALGRGLGLATVFTIVDEHGGGIRVTSELGCGSEFQIFLPESQAIGPTINVAPAEVTSGDAPAGEVLVIDDDQSILKTVSLLLKSLHAQPFLARDAAEALAVIRRRTKSLKAVVLDANLGGVDSVRLLQQIRITRDDLPVIICSGSDEAMVRKMFGDLKYERFLSKPYTVAELKTAIMGV